VVVCRRNQEAALAWEAPGQGLGDSKVGRHQRDEVKYVGEHSKSKAVFVDVELEELLEGVDNGVEVVRIDDTGEEGDPYEDYLAEGSLEPVECVLGDEEEAISINYTSGTTGRPKSVIYIHRGAYLCALGNFIEIGMNYETKYLWTLPMFHCHGWTLPSAVTAVVRVHVCLRKVEPARIWELFESENITHYCAALPHPDQDRQRGKRPRAKDEGDRRRHRRSAFPHAARPAQEAQHPPTTARLRVDRNVRPDNDQPTE